MSHLAVTLAALFIATGPAVAFACGPEEHQVSTEAPKPTIAVKTVTVPELAQLLKGKQVTVLDANSPETRLKHGVIPGAVLLTSGARFDPSRELPAARDAQLVFYCANTMCTASHLAASRAIEVGYTNVSVLPDGIVGWKKAGRSTALPNI